MSEVTSINQHGRRGKARQRPGPKRGDSWDLLDTGYDEDRFYTASVINEESERVYCRIDTSVWAQAIATASKPDFPAYRSVHDLLRDSIIHRLHHLSQGINDPVLDEWVQMLVRQGAVEAKRQMMRVARQTVSMFQEGFSEAEANKDWELANQMIEDARDAVEELREPYASDLSDAVERFAMSIKGKKNAVRVRGTDR